MPDTYNPTLPASYSFTDRRDVLPEEIMRLRESVGWSADTPERWSKILNDSLEVIIVRDESNGLVGLAFIAGNLRHAVMCDLVVAPAHQQRGIGEAIMAKLEQSVKILGVKYVYAELAKTNPFREKMVQSGFQDTGDSLFREV